jgi:protein ImuB
MASRPGTAVAARSADRPIRRCPAVWIAVHLPDLPLQAWALTLPPEQQKQPLALMAGARVAAVNAEAERCGVQPGMKRATALALAADLIRGQAEAAREAETLRAVAYAALQFTPAVALHDDATVVLEVSTTQRVMGGLPALLARLKSSISSWGLSLRVATAPTADGAALLASWPEADMHLKSERTPSLKELQNITHDAPLELLKAARVQWTQLQLMGLSTVGELRALPREALARRLGPELLAEVDALCGGRPQAHAWVSLPDQFEARLELPFRADTSEQVLYGAECLLQRLLVWARARRGRVRCVQWQLVHELRHRHGDETPPATLLELALAEPSHDMTHMQVLLRERLLHTPLPAPVSELRIGCSDLVFSEAPSGELFPTRASEQQGLLRLVERLQARLGRDAVNCLEAVEDHRPERATRCKPLDPVDWMHERKPRTARPRPRLAGSVVAAQASSKVTRPVWLLRDPQALPVVRSAPSLEGHPLRLLAGPERIESGWWDDLSVRDYFVAQTHDQSLVWIYRVRLPLGDTEPDGAEMQKTSADPPSASGWYLHGRFA